MTDAEVFFDDERVEEAKFVCGGCPLRDICLEHAVAHENHGIWAGTTPQERDVLRGTTLLATPEDARWADHIRDRVARGDLWAQIAQDERVSVRSLERWVAAELVRAAA